MDLPK